MRPDIDLQQVEQFITVARHGNLTKAAETLNLSQPALSRAIQKLEDQLGKPLFERKPRGVVLTEFGMLFHERAKEILHLVADTLTELSESDKTGTIRLGAIPTIAPYFLPSFLRYCANRHPEITISVTEGTTKSLAKAVDDGDLDLALVALPLDYPYLDVEKLFDEELFLVVSSANPLANAESIIANDLESSPFIQLSEAHCLAGNVDSYCEQRHVNLLSVEYLSQLVTVQELVALDHGVSLIPEMARQLDHNPRRTYRSLTDHPPQRTVAMVWNRYRYQSKWAKALRQTTHEYVDCEMGRQ